MQYKIEWLGNTTLEELCASGEGMNTQTVGERAFKVEGRACLEVSEPGRE